MSALERAIAERFPVEGLARTSPLGGLRRRRVTGVDVAAQSVAAVAPAGVALTNPSSLDAVAGPFAIVAVLTTVVVVVLLGLTIGVFTKRIASTGSLYTFVSRGLGRTAGIVAGVALAMGYAGVAMGTMFDAARRAAVFVTPVGSTDPPPPLVAGFLLLAAALIAVVIGVGVRISTRIMLVVEVLAVAMIAVVALVVFAASGWDLTPLRPSTAGGIDLDAVLSGVAVGLVAFVGFESGAALGRETRRPLATVPRAMLWTIIAVCLSYLIGASTHIVGSAVLEDGAASNGSSVPLAALGERAGLAGIAPLVDLIVILSYTACSLATITALVRLAFVMSREGLVPRALGRTTARRKTPLVGGLLITSAIAIVPLTALVVTGSAEAVGDTADTAGIIGYLLAYLSVAVAAPVFLVRIGEFQRLSLLPAGLAVVALGPTLVHYVAAVRPEDVVRVWAPLAVLAATSALLILRTRRHPGVAARIGLFDAPIAADSIGGTRPGIGGHGSER